MSAILFLLGAVVIAVVGIVILVLLTREPSRSSLSSIDDFTRRKEALAPRHMSDNGRRDAARHAVGPDGERDLGVGERGRGV